MDIVIFQNMKKVIKALYLKTFLPHVVRFTNGYRYLSKYEIGEYTYGKPKVWSWDENTTLKIGRFCSISADVNIFLGGEHRIDWVTTYPFNVIFKNAREFKGHPASKGDIIIGNDVWIVAWWNWPLEKIEEAYPLLLSNQITTFISKYK
jgi:acetyltransferase-like isoleucine patch superfamily enzyme